MVTDPAADDADATVILPTAPDAAGRVHHFLMGPALTTGASLESAVAVLEFAQWNVQVTALEGPEGIGRFNEAARTCYYESPDPVRCPTGQLGIVLDHVVESAPVVNALAFERDRINITGAFSEAEARDLALVLDYGALPLEFEDPAESGLVRTVSATLGRDALRAGLIAGIVGLALVALYMLAYYRLLGLVALGSLAVSGVLLWVVVSFLSTTQGLALTLAGVTGLIVAIGVSLDSNVIYFEHLKEDVLGGRTLRQLGRPGVPPSRSGRSSGPTWRRSSVRASSGCSPSARYGGSPPCWPSPPSWTWWPPTSSCDRWCAGWPGGPRTGRASWAWRR